MSHPVDTKCVAADEQNILSVKVQTELGIVKSFQVEKLKGQFNFPTAHKVRLAFLCKFIASTKRFSAK